MSRPNLPWYRKNRDQWCVKLNGRLRSLGVTGANSRAAANAAFAKLLAEKMWRPTAPPAPPTPTSAAPVTSSAAPSAASTPQTVCEVVALALESCRSRTKPATHARYKFDAEAFCAACGGEPATSLTPAAVAAWLHARPNNDTTKAIMLRSLSAVLGRAVALGLLPTNPARSVPRPRSRSRSASAVISPEDHAKLLAAATPQLRLVLALLHATGARPGEVCGITAENFDAANGVVVLTTHKTDRTGRPRLLFLTPEAVELLTAQRAKFPTGSLLRSTKGVPWRSRSLVQAMRKLRKKAGVPNAIAYGYRHTLATDALAKGVPDATVAALLGHTSTVVLHANYSHLTSRARTLREAAGLVRGAPSADAQPSG